MTVRKTLRTTIDCSSSVTAGRQSTAQPIAAKSAAITTMRAAVVASAPIRADTTMKAANSQHATAITLLVEAVKVVTVP
ncbi:hypothetical protein GCM10011512_18210 [Tersicoccus solisilvae]|uniref:Uncharacterized protein n=1 Tax=Tersicoccus solisilvae TaxID=1882339 RepID=A0ABQ1P901_9MICC|nr:hypothetical protein GCM10011512_18210 [Tersicoccus solisilvae]